MQSGLQFFPLDVNTDTKLALIECEFGIKGFAVIVKLWQKIYGEEGYYIRWSKDVALLFSREIGLGYNVVSEIISAAIERDIFCARMAAQYGILTSSGIQKRYLEAVKRRKEVFLICEYLLVDVGQKYANVHITEGNVYIPKENEYKTNQINKEINKQDDDGQTASDVYISLFGGELTEMVACVLKDAERKLPLSVIKYILELAKTDGKKWNWIKTVLQNAIKDGVKSVEDFERIRQQHSIKHRTEKKNSFTDYAQSSNYDFEEIERRALEKRMREFKTG